MQKPRNGSERFGTVSRAVVYFRKTVGTVSEMISFYVQKRFGNGLERFQTLISIAYSGF